MILATSSAPSGNKLKKLRLCDGRAVAECVLIAPRYGARKQRLLLLKGSILRPREVDSCPALAVRLRRQWLQEGILVERNGGLILQRDQILDSPSLAANMVMGASKNGWDFWKYGRQSLTQAWKQNPPPLVFYDLWDIRLSRNKSEPTSIG